MMILSWQPTAVDRSIEVADVCPMNSSLGHHVMSDIVDSRYSTAQCDVQHLVGDESALLHQVQVDDKFTQIDLHEPAEQREASVGSRKHS